MQSMGIDHENWSNSQLTYSWKHFNKKCFLLVRSPTSWPTRATLPCDSSSPTGWTSNYSTTCAGSISRHDRLFFSELKKKKAHTSNTPRSRSSSVTQAAQQAGLPAIASRARFRIFPGMTATFLPKLRKRLSPRAHHALGHLHY